MKTNEVLENIKARRSVRAYTGQQVLEEDLQAILEAATYAPSGMHLETWHFTAIQNMDKLTELNERIKGAFAKSDDSRLQERGHSKTYCCYYHAPTTCDDPEVREFITALGVPANHKVYGCVALGYPDSKIPMKEKKVKVNTITIVR